MKRARARGPDLCLFVRVITDRRDVNQKNVNRRMENLEREREREVGKKREGES